MWWFSYIKYCLVVLYTVFHLTLVICERMRGIRKREHIAPPSGVTMLLKT